MNLLAVAAVTRDRAPRVTARGLVDFALRRCASLTIIGSLIGVPVIAQTLPQGGKVTAGSATIDRPNAKGVTVKQSSNRAVIDWNSFSIGSHDTVNYVVPSSTSATLNRVTGSMTSVIAGELHSNGELYLVNPNGIEITPTGVINTESFTASALAMTDADFLSGRNLFTGRGNSAGVANQGLISVAPRGSVLLVGGTVMNAGSIVAPEGKVGLAAGESVSVDLEGDQFLTVSVPTANVPLLRALITQSGRIQAAGGQVSLRGVTTADVARAAIEVSGEIDAASVSQRTDGVDFGRRTAPAGGGAVSIDGGSGGSVEITGQISATSARGTGGSISATGEDVVLKGATLDASGPTGGGTILIGGGAQGQGPLTHAATTTVDAASTITANATLRGNGGHVVLWSDQATEFDGIINALGGLQGGNGGLVETSSRDNLNVLGLAHTNARSPSGHGGEWLLDPADITISTSADSNMSESGSPWTATGQPGNVSTTTIDTALNAGTSVDITTNSGTGTGGSGNITVNAPIVQSSGSGGATLTLAAYKNITLNSSITSISGPLNMVFSAANGAFTASNVSLITNGGSLSISAPNSGAANAVNLTSTTINVGAGSGSISGSTTTGTGVAFSGANILTNGGSSTFTVNGTSNNDTGINFLSGATLTTSGAVTLTGTGLAAGAYYTGVNFTGNNTITDTAGNLGISGSDTPGWSTIVEGSLTLANSGTGTLTVNGTGANIGISLEAATTLINSGSGTLALNGTSSGSTGLNIGAGISTTGTVSVSGNSSGGNNGLVIQGNPQILDNSGNLTMTGSTVGGASGLWFNGSPTLTNGGGGSLAFNGNNSTGNGVAFGNGTQNVTTSGSMSITGTTTSSGTGLRLTGTANQLTDSGGTLTVTGVSATGIGLQINSPTTKLTNSGAGSFAVTGTSTSGVGSQFSGTSTLTDAGAGSLTLTGTHSGSGASDGIEFLAGATVTTSGTVTLSGSGSGAGNASNGLHFAGTSGLVDSSGNLTVTGVGASGGSGVWFNGVTTLTNGGAGSFSMSGSNSTANGFGIALGNGTQSLTTSGPISLSGTESSSGYGIRFVNTSTITDSSGNLTVTGASTSGVGIQFSTTNTLANSGTGSFAVTGTSSSGVGTQMTGAATLTNSNTGTLSVSGTSSGAVDGIQLAASASLHTTGPVSLSGASSTGTGIDFLGSNTVTDNSGALTMSGTSTAGNGVSFSGADSLTNSGAGSVSITGTSSTGTGLILNSGASVTNSGTLGLSGTSTSLVGLRFSGATLTTSSGNTTVNGTSGSNTGIYFSGSDRVNNNGAGSLVMAATSAGYRAWELNTGASFTTAGNVTVNATTSTGTGVYVDGNGTVSVSSGTLNLIGTASSSGRGANLLGSNTLSTTGSGALNISGSSSSGIGMKVVGNSSLTTSGSVTFTGTSSSGNGLFIQGANSLTVSSGSLSVTGNSTSAVGVDISGANGVSNGGGTLTITGTSSSGNGVQIESSSSLATTGNLSIAGTSTGGYGINLSAGDNITASTGNLTLSGNSTSSFGQELMSAGSITNSGTGTLTLSSVGGIDLNASITSTNGPAAITGSGNITQSAGTVAVNNLLLSGTSGNFTLNASGNQIRTLAANAAIVTVNDQSALTIGSVLGTAGVTTSAGVTLTTNGNLTIASGAPVSGPSPVLATSGAFINDAGSGAVTATSGHWLIYSSSPSSDTFGLLNSGNTALWNATDATLPPASVTGSGNFYLFALQPTLTFTSTDASKTYGVDDTSSIAGNYTTSGYQSGVANAFLADTAATVYAGTPAVTSAGSISAATVTGGPYAITVAPGSMTSLEGYALSFQSSGLLTVNPATLTVTASNQSKTYGTTFGLGTTAFTETGLVNSDTLSAVTLSSPGAVASATVAGGPYAITPSNAMGTGLSNYSIDYVNGALTVKPATLIGVVTAANKVYDGTTTATLTSETLSGSIYNGDASNLNLTFATANFNSKNVLTADTVTATGLTLSGSAASNYELISSTATTSASITPRPLTISADSESQIYGNPTPAFTYALRGQGLVSDDGLSGSLSAGTTLASHVGSYWISLGTLTASPNYVVTYFGNTLTIDPRPLAVIANPESQLFGYPMPPLTYSVGGLVNGDHLTGALSTPPYAKAIVGSYPITQGTLAASSDYTLTYFPSTLTVISTGWPTTAELAARTYASDLELFAVSADVDNTVGMVDLDQSATCRDPAARAIGTRVAPALEPGATLSAQEARCANAWARGGKGIDWRALAAGRTAMTMPSTQNP